MAEGLKGFLSKWMSLDGRCEVRTVPYVTGQLGFAVAGMGDRRHGMPRDEEMIVGCPFSKQEKPGEMLKRRFPSFG
jgi:uncharacterized protein (DUF169 family)